MELPECKSRVTQDGQNTCMETDLMPATPTGQPAWGFLTCEYLLRSGKCPDRFKLMEYKRSLRREALNL